MILHNKLLFILFLIIVINLKAEVTNEYYILVDSAEKCIMQSKYSESIKLYNRAFQLSRLSDLSYKNYVKVLKTNDELLPKYYDTLRYFDSIYDIRKINIYFKDSNQTTVPLKSYNATCEEFIQKFNLMANDDKNIRDKAIKVVGQKNIYEVEPFKSQIRAVDSYNYLKIVNLLLDTQNRSCYHYALTKVSLISHSLSRITYSMTIKLDEVLINLARSGLIDNIVVANLLSETYNSSNFHKPKTEYQFSGEIVKTKNYLLISKLDKSKIYKINELREKLNLESYESFVLKVIWQAKQDKFKFYILPQWDFSNSKEEFEFINQIYDPSKIELIKLNEK